MDTNTVIENFFNTIPDANLIQIAENDWDMLLILCMSLTLDIQLYSESLKKRNLVS